MKKETKTNTKSKTKTEKTKKVKKIDLDEFIDEEELDDEDALINALNDDAYEVEDDEDDEKDLDYEYDEPLHSNNDEDEEEPQEQALTLGLDDEDTLTLDLTEEKTQYEDEIDEYEEEPRLKEKRNINSSTINRIINISFIVVVVLIMMITVDIVAVAKYETGPFFAFHTKTYKDGGTKVFTGLGYKVIKYNQLEGRKGITIGFWTMPYQVEPTSIDILDLAIEFEKDKEKTANKFYKQYLKVTGEIKSIDQDNKKVVLEYTDTDGKYTLQVVAKLTDEVIISSLKEKDQVEVYGIAKKFSVKTKKKSNRVELVDCFVKKTEE